MMGTARIVAVDATQPLFIALVFAGAAGGAAYAASVRCPRLWSLTRRRIPGRPWSTSRPGWPTPCTTAR